jgi:hypothetical protein
MSYLNVVGVALSVIALVWDRGSGGAHRYGGRSAASAS